MLLRCIASVAASGGARASQILPLQLAGLATASSSKAAATALAALAPAPPPHSFCAFSLTPRAAAAASAAAADRSASHLHTSAAAAMPTVGVVRDHLFEKLGCSFTDDEFQDLCFEYGIELDDVTTEKEIMRKELHKVEDTAAAAAGKGTGDEQEEVLYKIDIPANRYDMLCVEGIARALNVFRQGTQPPTYRLTSPAAGAAQRMVVRPETALVRPFVVCAVLRGVRFDAARYKSFIDLQDKLHQNLCRQRSLVAIGTHDLSTIQGPFSYEALPPDQIQFVPLKQTREFKADELMQHYLDHDLKLRKFVPLLKGSIVYPVIYDANRTVLSLPPIINGAHSAISLQTRDMLIECTATDLTKAKVVLNTVVTMFSEYCEVPFEVEPVEVVDAAGQTTSHPDLSCRELSVPMASINGTLGLDLSGADAAALLRRVQLGVEVVQGGNQGPGEVLRVSVPPTRSDILHACDVVEDVAIAHGYNNIPKRIPGAYTQGRELPLNQFTELLRAECAMAGFTEVLTWALCSRLENFDSLRRPDDGSAVEIGNPATAEFEVCRTTLLSAALKTLGANKDAALPIKLFEVSDVIAASASHETGARNQRRLVAVICNREAGFEVIHGLLNRVMEVLGVPLAGTDPALESKAGVSYSWVPSQDPAFFAGRQAVVMAGGQGVGCFGIIHPEVLEKFDIPYPVSALELNIEPFCFDQRYKSLLH